MSDRNPIRGSMAVEIDELFASPDFQAMKDFQRWWYMSLLFRAWQNDEMPCHLSADWDSLWTKAGAPSLKDWQKHSAIVRGKFSATEDGMWIFNAPQLARYERALSAYLKKVEGGRAGSKKRWDDHRLAIAKLKDTESQKYSSVSLNTEIKPKELKYEFSLEDFDGQVEFIRLCEAHPKPEENDLASRYFYEAVEWAIARKGFKTRKEASDWIIERASRYGQIADFKYGLINWLDKKIFNQSETAWRSSSAKVVNTSKFYDEHGNSRFAKSGLQK